MTAERLRRGAAALLFGMAMLAPAGCGAGPGSAAVVGPAPQAARPDLGGILRSDPAGRVARLSLTLGQGAGYNGFNVDGLGKGRLRIAVPAGWTVDVSCRNQGLFRSSCGVIDGTDTGGLAFPGSATSDPVAGIAPGQAAAFSFVAARVGSFRLSSLVPGQMQAGMWASLAVVAGGDPSVSSV